MRGLVVIALAGCGFHGPAAIGEGVDAGDAATIDSSITGDACYGRGSFAVCVPMPPARSIDYTTTTQIDTAMTGGSNCDFIIGGTCVISATAITVESDVVVRATGPNPIVFAASGSITITGTIDVASYRGGGAGAGFGAGVCTSSTPGTNDSDGAGGGAGGSFTTLAGGGGNGHNNAPGGQRGAVIAIPTTLRGGCAGTAGGMGQAPNGGGRGAGGGAVGLYAELGLAISGYVDASGAGGGAGKSQNGGGGGGGSGGVIVLDAGATLMVTGRLYANGGGGGSGASTTNNGAAGFETVPGHVVTESSSVPGGSGGMGGNNGGNGAAGATRGNAAGGGMGADAGAGGGGGAVGAIRVTSGQAAQIPTASASPAPG